MSQVVSAEQWVSSLERRFRQERRRLHRVPMDGHCLFHAVRASLDADFNYQISQQEAADKLRTEINDKIDNYSVFMASNGESAEQVLKKQLEDYILRKRFDTEAVDIFVQAFCNALNVILDILQLTLPQGDVTSFQVKPWEEGRETRSLHLFRRGLEPMYHYDALVGAGSGSMSDYDSGIGYLRGYRFGEMDLELMDEEDVFDNSPEEPYTPHSKETYTRPVSDLPPEDFTLVPVTPSSNSNILRRDSVSRRKSHRASYTSKRGSSMYCDLSVFKFADTHTVDVAKTDPTSFNQLMWQLIHSRGITNHMEIVRILGLWLSTKDLKQLLFPHANKGSPEEALSKLKREEITYAEIFKILCDYGGVECVVVPGITKGVDSYEDYRPGQRISDDSYRHHWNAVFVDGMWRLLDCAWAARHWITHNLSPQELQFRLEELYFMTDPEQFIFSHFPTDPEWQLLEHPVTKEEFENFVKINTPYFTHRLLVRTPREAIIRTSGQEIVIKLQKPWNSDVEFNFQLSMESGRTSLRGVPLEKYGMHEMVDTIAVFTIRPPQQGSYRLILFARKKSQQANQQVQKYASVCQYQLECEGCPYSKRIEPFPPCSTLRWGAGQSADRYNIQPLEPGAIHRTEDGYCEVSFQMPKKLNFLAKLKSHNYDDATLKGHVLTRCIGDLVVFTARPPSRGEYGLEIYASDPQVDGNLFNHCYQYLVVCDEDLGRVDRQPEIQVGYLGEHQPAERTGFTCVNRHDPFVVYDASCGYPLEIAIGTSLEASIKTHLYRLWGSQKEELSDYVLQQARYNQIIFTISPPKAGFYTFEIYAKPLSDPGNKLDNVFNYMIHCINVTTIPRAYPKQAFDWKTRACFLHSPLEGSISRRHEKELFQVEIPGAKRVQVKIEECWQELNQMTPVLWEGTIDLKPKTKYPANKVTLLAAFSEKWSEFTHLLEYSIK